MKFSVLGVSNLSKEFTNLKQDMGLYLMRHIFPEVLNAKNINNIMKLIYKNWNEDSYFEYIKSSLYLSTKIFKDFSRGNENEIVHRSYYPIIQTTYFRWGNQWTDPWWEMKFSMCFNDFTRDENHSILLSCILSVTLKNMWLYLFYS